MKNFWNFGMIILIVLLGSSCRTYKTLEKVKPVSASASLVEELHKLKAGDKIKVYKKTGSSNVLKFTSANENELLGVLVDGSMSSPVSIRIDNIDQLKVKKTNWPLTAVSIPVGLFATWLIVGTIAFELD
jgi:hypothetical protein